MMTSLLAKYKVALLVGVCIFAGSFYLGTVYTQSKWDREKAQTIADSHQSLNDSTTYSYGLGTSYEHALKGMYEQHEDVKKSINQFIDPCVYSSTWWLLHDSAAINRATPVVPNGATTPGP